jgi:hypothetical protein
MPQDIKNKFAASVLTKHIKNGDTTFLQDTPRSKRLIKTLTTTDAHVDEKYKSYFIEHAVSTFLEDSKNKFLHPLPSPTTNPMADQNISTDVVPHGLKQKSNNNPTKIPGPAPPIQCVEREHSNKSNNNPTKIPGPAPPTQCVEREHSNNAAALDFFGPSFLVSKTYQVKNVRKEDNIPTGSTIRILRCNDKMCSTKVVVWSVGSGLDSFPAYSRIFGEEKHNSHRPPSWIDWYKYKLQFYTSHNKSSWDLARFPKRPGLPHFLLLAVQRVVKTSPSVNPAMAANTVGQQYNTHPLFEDSKIREILHKQLCEYTRRTKKHVAPSMSLVKRVSYMGDITDFIRTHRINYDALAAIGWTPYLRSGSVWLNSMAGYLKKSGVLHDISLHGNLPERGMVVLDSDEVLANPRWQLLCAASDRVHKTGPDPRGRTIVFSSLSLLSNAVWAHDHQWNICGSCDGTHAITSTEFKLITLGFTSFCGRSGSRRFHPLVYGFGEGEREIVVIHTFLNLKIALRNLFGIEEVIFKRGIVSDAAPALVNAMTVCFPGSPPLQCYPHIIRKFMVEDRPGNGGYEKNLKKQKKDWLNSEAQDAIRMCSFSKTKEQRNKLWELTQSIWEAAGEKELAKTFCQTYIEDVRYDKWYYTASGLHGCVPCNNPMERHNLSIKGSANFAGLVTLNCSMHTALSQEFVKLVYETSTNLVNPSNDLPVLDFNFIWKQSLFTNDYLNIMKPDVDMVAYGSGWLMNGNEYLGMPIQAQDVKEMEDALKGEIKQQSTLEETRRLLLNNTKRFHHVTASVWTDSNGNEVDCCVCDCRQFYFNRYCWQSAYMQHRERLQIAYQPVKAKNKCSRRKMSSFALQRKEFSQARIRIAQTAAEERRATRLHIAQATDQRTEEVNDQK